MAVDFDVPLITNVKNAKMLAEALVRKYPLNVSTVDSKSSHNTHTFPGLVNISAFVPNLAVEGGDDLVEMTKASVSAGFTTAIVIPLGHNNRITDRQSLELAKSNVHGQLHSNYALSVTATAANVNLDEEFQAEAKSLFVPFHVDNDSTSLSVVASHFATWPAEKPIVTNAKGSDLASILLLASLHDRTVHVTDIQSSDDLLLISLSKAKHLKVTCDVSIYSLFLTKEEFPHSRCLPTAEEQTHIWQKLDIIDAFSVGSAPYRLAMEVGEVASPWSGLEEALPLLLTAVTEGRLTLDDIRLRLHDNPVQIFGLPDQARAHVEVVVGRKAPFTKRPTCWSPLERRFVKGSVHRVIVHDQTAFLDGSIASSPQGRDISSATIVHPPTVPPKDVDASHGQITAFSSMSSQSSTATAPHLFSHLLPHPSFHRRHILSVKQITHKDMYDLFTLAHEMRLQVERNGTLDILKGKVLCTLFYEPSTRTSSSFDAAMKRCGGEVVQVSADTSSVLKGESLPDTIRTLACYGDAIVIRHPDVGSAQLAAKFSPVPIINAGDGIGEHPTQVSLFRVYIHR